MTPGPPVRRLLVPLDASVHALAALDAAVRLGGLWQVEVACLYVEDSDLLLLASLPTGRLVGRHGRSLHVTARPEMSCALRRLADRTRRATESAASRGGVRCSFRVVEGRPADAVVAEAGREDLVLMGRAGAASSVTRRLGSTARAVVESPRVTVLLVGRDAPIGRPVVLVHDGSEASLRALSLATALARSGPGPLTVYAAEGSDLQPFHDPRASLAADGRGLVLRRLVGRGNGTPFPDARGAVLVLPRGPLLGKRAELARRLESARGPVLLVA